MILKVNFLDLSLGYRPKLVATVMMFNVIYVFFVYIQGRIQLLSKMGVHIRHTICLWKKLIFGKNIVYFL